MPGGDHHPEYTPWNTEFMAVRFGNVPDSHGSVVPIFEKQIKAGGLVTLSDPSIVRIS